MNKVFKISLLVLGFTILGVVIAQVVGTPPAGFWQRNTCPPGSVVYKNDGTFTVPDGCHTVTLYAWGGGGGGGESNLEGNGGGGGFSTVKLSGLTPGETLAIEVGKGGLGGMCGTAGAGGSGGYNGGAGSSSTGSAGGNGQGPVAGGTGGTKIGTASNGGGGRYGGGGGGAAGSTVMTGGGGGGATVVTRNSTSAEVLIAGGGGGGGAESAGENGEAAGDGGPGCGVNGTNGSGSSGAEFAGGGGGGLCVGDSTQNGSGILPGNNTDAYGAGIGGTGSNISCETATGANGKVIVDYGLSRPVDITPFGVDWLDFTSLSETEAIFGIETSIDVQISVAYGVGTPAAKYSLNGGALADVTPGSPVTLTISNRDTLQFELTDPVDGRTATFTVRNMTDGGKILDTFTGTTKFCSGVVVGGYCWYKGEIYGSCTAACTEHGGYNSATRTYAGDLGTNANCQAVLAALGSTDSTTSAKSDCTFGIGCMNESSNGNTRCTNPITTEGALDAFQFATRACACKF